MSSDVRCVQFYRVPSTYFRVKTQLMENKPSNAQGSIQRTTGWLSIASGLIALVSYYLVAASVHFNFEFFSNPAIVFQGQPVDRGMLRWSMIADVFGYYLLLLPLMFFLGRQMDAHTPWSGIVRFLGTSYVLMGAAGASVLAVVWPFLLDAHSAADASLQPSIALLFQTSAQGVVTGIWNLLDGLLGGAWWIAVSWFLLNRMKFLAYLGLLTGMFSLLDAVGNMLEWKALADISVNAYLVLAPVWAMFAGAALLRRRDLFV